MTRFVAPRYFTQDQNDAVEQALRELNIGDDEGVRIFIIALEYELAEYEKLASSRRPQETMQEPAAPELEKLSRDITAIAQQLEQMPEHNRPSLLERLTGQDPFGRVYDQAYLDAVVAELTRIASVCVGEKQGPPAVNGLSDAERHFISTVAEAYFECFETLPRSGGGEPFTSLLRRIVDISGLNIPLNKSELEPLLSSIG